ncbi:MAG: autotransporter-associated beta strand repeat-containing protein, partial [Acidobacteriota bacterium]|nr:autotransporter-associated beta strand repeat-containing protein [Acidobacteriota bacterium]
MDKTVKLILPFAVGLAVFLPYFVSSPQGLGSPARLFLGVFAGMAAALICEPTPHARMSFIALSPVKAPGKKTLVLGCAVALLALASSPLALAQQDVEIDFDATTDYSSDTPDAFGNLYVCGNSASGDPGRPPCDLPPEDGPYKLTVTSDGKVADAFGGYHLTSGDIVATGDSATVEAGGEALDSVVGSYASTSGTATATDNHAIVEGAVGADVVGGIVNAGDAAAGGNTMRVDGGTVANHAAGGLAYSSGEATAKGNTADVTGGGVIHGGVVGGGAGGGADTTAEGNAARVDGGTVDGHAAGGKASSLSGEATAKGNRVDVANGGAVGGDVYGGSAEGAAGATAEGNAASVAGAAGSVFGGTANAPAAHATAKDNRVDVAADGEVSGIVVGGRADGDAGAAAEGNTASIDGGTVENGIAGGEAYSSGDAAVKDNTAAASNGGKVGNDVYGGRAVGAAGATAEGNTARIDGGMVYGGVSGGEAYSSGEAVAKGNKVDVVNGGKVGNDVYGGSAEGDAGATAEGNTVRIAGGTVDGWVYGGSANSYAGDAKAAGNRADVESGGEATSVYGGYVAGDAASSVVEGNAANVAGKAANAYGGYVHAFSGDAIATGNSAVVSGEVSDSVYGGYADSDGTGGATGKASGNTVLIDGGTVGGVVYGGYSLVDASGETGEATGNTVTVQGAASLADVYGGFVGDAGAPDATMDAFTGNTLVKNSDAAIASAGNFENVRFGYAGDANIGTLDTTPTGSAKTAVNVDVGDGDVKFTSADKITGSGGVLKTGAGVLTLAGENDYTGGTAVNDGTLQIGDGGTAGSVKGDIDISAAARVVFNRSDDAVYGGVVTGGGSLEKKGAGVLTLAGENDYAGGTAVSDGTLQIGDGGAAGSVLGDIDVANGARVVFNRSDDAAYGGVVTGGGSLEKKGAGVLTVTGENTYTGGTTVNDGTLQIGDGGTAGSVKGDIDISAAARVVFNRSDDAAYGGVVTGAGSLTKKGAGVLTLSGASDNYTGATTVEAGGLDLTGSLAKSAVAVRNSAFLDLKGLAWGVLLDPGATLNAYDGGGVGVGGIRASGAG